MSRSLVDLFMLNWSSFSWVIEYFMIGYSSAALVVGHIIILKKLEGIYIFNWHYFLEFSMDYLLLKFFLSALRKCPWLFMLRLGSLELFWFLFWFNFVRIVIEDFESWFNKIVLEILDLDGMDCFGWKSAYWHQFLWRFFNSCLYSDCFWWFFDQLPKGVIFLDSFYGSLFGGLSILLKSDIVFLRFLKDNIVHEVILFGKIGLIKS